jgi:hypothetical protein
MTFKVPLAKDDKFKMEFFNLISRSIDDLYFENQKLPDKIIFSGVIGKELFDLITSLNWNLNNFNPSFENGPNKIIFKYLKSFTRTQNPDSPIVTLPDKIEGFPGNETISKLMMAYVSPRGAFKIEKTVDPTLEIRLIR